MSNRTSWNEHGMQAQPPVQAQTGEEGHGQSVAGSETTPAKANLTVLRAPQVNPTGESDVDLREQEDDLLPPLPAEGISSTDGDDMPWSQEESGIKKITLGEHLCSMWFIYVVVITPIACIPIITLAPDTYERQAGCAYTIAVMSVLWCTEALPIPVTSLIPIFLLPMLDVMGARETSSAYITDTSMLFMGGLLVAIAIEVWNLHKRLALMTLRIAGAEPRFLLLGITLVTWFLSMWISNTATAAMMMTIVTALLEQFEGIYTVHIPDKRELKELNEKAIAAGQTPRTVEDFHKEAENNLRHFLHLNKAMCLTVAYASNIGGTGSLTGTGPNLVFLAQVQRVYGAVGLESPITFSTWLVIGLPLSLSLELLMWGCMVMLHLRCEGGCRCLWCRSPTTNQHLETVNSVIEKEYRKLGPVSYAEKSVLVCFFWLIVFWITRDLGGAGGWANMFNKVYVQDSTPAILFGCLMFVLPSNLPTAIREKCATNAPYQRVTPLLQWKHVHEKMPWSLYLLLGGGFALAKAITVSGLASVLGVKMLVLGSLNDWVIMIIISYIACFATELTSNTATATIMMPILSEMALALETNPLFFMFPAAITTSFAFMLPVATPPNAIVFGTGALRVIDMVAMGFILNILCPLFLFFAMATWGDAFFQFAVIPPQLIRNATKRDRLW